MPCLLNLTNSAVVFVVIVWMLICILEAINVHCLHNLLFAHVQFCLVMLMTTITIRG